MAIMTQKPLLPPPSLWCYHPDKKGETEAESKVATCPWLLRALQTVRRLHELLVCGQHLFACHSLRKPSSADGRMLFLGIYMRSKEYQDDQTLICSRVKDPVRAWLSQGQSAGAGVFPIALEAPSPRQAEERETFSLLPSPACFSAQHSWPQFKLLTLIFRVFQSFVICECLFV